jgi:hypothetical protein
VVEAAAGRLDGDVVGRQLNVGVGVAVVLLDVGLEVVEVGDRPEMWRQCREGGECHVVAAVTDLSRIITSCQGHDLGSRLAVWVGHRTLEVAVVFLVLGMLLVLNIMTLMLLALHDPVDAAWRTVLVVIVEATPELRLFALMVTLVDVATGIVTATVLVEVGT